MCVLLINSFSSLLLDQQKLETHRIWKLLLVGWWLLLVMYPIFIKYNSIWLFILFFASFQSELLILEIWQIDFTISVISRKEDTHGSFGYLWLWDFWVKQVQRQFLLYFSASVPCFETLPLKQWGLIFFTFFFVFSFSFLQALNSFVLIIVMRSFSSFLLSWH